MHQDDLRCNERQKSSTSYLFWDLSIWRWSWNLRDKCTCTCGGGIQKRERACNIKKPNQVSDCLLNVYLSCTFVSSKLDRIQLSAIHFQIYHIWCFDHVTRRCAMACMKKTRKDLRNRSGNAMLKTVQVRIWFSFAEKFGLGRRL